MRRTSAKYLNTGSFQIIPNFSRLRIKEKCQPMDAVSSIRHARPCGAHLEPCFWEFDGLQQSPVLACWWWRNEIESGKLVGQETQKNVSFRVIISQPCLGIAPITSGPPTDQKLLYSWTQGRLSGLTASGERVAYGLPILSGG